MHQPFQLASSRRRSRWSVVTTTLPLTVAAHSLAEGWPRGGGPKPSGSSQQDRCGSCGSAGDRRYPRRAETALQQTLATGDRQQQRRLRRQRLGGGTSGTSGTRSVSAGAAPAFWHSGKLHHFF
jgi:hypothetical protein